MKEEKTNFEKWIELYGQSRLAADLGVSRQLVNRWVKGLERPSDYNKIKIVKLSNNIAEYNDFFKDIK